MNKYDIEIEEVLRKVIQDVEAPNINDAVNIVEEMYDNDEIELYSSDLVEKSFNNLYSKKLDKDMSFYLKYDASNGILVILHDDHKEGKYVCDEARDLYRCFEAYVEDYIEEYEITSDIGIKENGEELEKDDIDMER